jgi:hypothetical protein
LPRCGGVADRGLLVDAEHGGQVQWVGPVGEGFFELPVDAEPFEGGGKAAGSLGGPEFSCCPVSRAVCWVISR